MTKPTDSGRRKTADRRQEQRRDPAGTPPDRRDLVAAAAPETAKQRPGSANAASASAAFAAQLLGQPGAKRGLKGGPPVLEGARSAYLETEFLGGGERRARKGVIAKTEI